jgi:hypothetical protein
MPARDVFISHSSADAAIARELRAIVEGAGFTCWMAPDDIVGTETWTEQILDAIHESRAMVVLVSAASNKSQHVSREVNLALGRHRAVLPIRIEAVEPEGPLEYLLSLVQHLDAFPPPISSHRDRIIRRLESIVHPQADAPTEAVILPSGPVAAPPAAPPAAPATSPIAPAAPAVMTHAAPTAPVPSPAPVAARRSGVNPGLLVVGGIVAVAVAVAAFSGSLFGSSNPTPPPTQAAVITQAPVTEAPTVEAPTEPPGTEEPPATAEASVDAGDYPNELEQQLLDLQEGTTVDVSTCRRFEDRYSLSLAMIQCDPPADTGSDRVIFFVLYPETTTMTSDYDGIMAEAEVPRTTTGCFDLDQANNAWSYTDDGVAGPAAGFLGCYPRTEDEVSGIQYLWTLDDLDVMGLWLAPDYQAGLDFFNDWVVAVRPT